MSIVLTVSTIVIAVIFGIAFALPCEACKQRRERMRNAYERWKSNKQRSNT